MNHRSLNELSFGCQQRELRGDQTYSYLFFFSRGYAVPLLIDLEHSHIVTKRQ